MLSLIRQRTRAISTAPDDMRARGILIYRRRADVQVPDCCWLVGYAESNGLAGRILPQKAGGFRALRWRERGGYVDLGVFVDIQVAIMALAPKKA
jgi:hypothetical protein